MGQPNSQVRCEAVTIFIRVVDQIGNGVQVREPAFFHRISWNFRGLKGGENDSLECKSY